VRIRQDREYLGRFDASQEALEVHTHVLAEDRQQQSFARAVGGCPAVCLHEHPYPGPPTG